MFDKKKKTKIKTKVLVVEDDSLLLQVLIEGLKSEGFEVVGEENGLKAVSHIEKFMPDVILLDLILPGLDGFAILKELKSNKETDKIPVIVVSNLSSISDVKAAKAVGAEEYFIKSNTQMDEIVKFIKSKHYGK